MVSVEIPVVFGVVAFIKDTDDSDVANAKHNT